MCDSFARALHLSQDLISDYSLTWWMGFQRQKITLLRFRERIQNQKFKIHWLTKSVCIYHRNVSTALMLFKNNLITKFHLSDWIGYKFWMFYKKCCKVIFCKWEFVKQVKMKLGFKSWLKWSARANESHIICCHQRSFLLSVRAVAYLWNSWNSNNVSWSKDLCSREPPSFCPYRRKNTFLVNFWVPR